MRSKNLNNDLVEDYLDDVLTSQEKENFEKELQSNKSLRDELALAKRVRESLSEKGGLISTIGDIDEELENEGLFKKDNVIKMNKNSKIPFAIAATLLVLLSAFWFLKTDESQINSDQIIADSFSKFKSSIPKLKEEFEVLGFADPEAGLKDSLSTALDYIDSGKYDDARLLLSTILDRYPDNTKALYYYGVNQLNLGNYTIASEALYKAKQTDNLEIKHDAHYNYAISLMKLDDDHASAIKELKIIAADDTSPYKYVARDYVSILEG